MLQYFSVVRNGNTIEPLTGQKTNAAERKEILRRTSSG